MITINDCYILEFYSIKISMFGVPDIYASSNNIFDIIYINLFITFYYRSNSLNKIIKILDKLLWNINLIISNFIIEQVNNISLLKFFILINSLHYTALTLSEII